MKIGIVGAMAQEVEILSQLMTCLLYTSLELFRDVVIFKFFRVKGI